MHFGRIRPPFMVSVFISLGVSDKPRCPDPRRSSRGSSASWEPGVRGPHWAGEYCSASGLVVVPAGAEHQPGEPEVLVLDLPGGWLRPYCPGPLTVNSSRSDSILPSWVQMVPWASQSVVTGRTTVTAASESGATWISHPHPSKLAVQVAVDQPHHVGPGDNSLLAKEVVVYGRDDLVPLKHAVVVGVIKIQHTLL